MSDTPPVCDYEGSDYRTRFWEQGGRSYEDQVERIALRKLLPAGGDTLLDVGAGFGRLAAEYAGYRRVVLLDYSRSLLREAQALLGDDPRFLFVAADWYRMPFVPGVFDALVQVRTIHHAADAPALLAQLARIIRRDGRYVLEFANKRNLKAMARYALRRQTWSPYDPEPVEFVALNFDFHPRWMLAALRSAGFQPDEVRSVSHFRLALLKRLLPPSLLVRLDQALQPTGRWVALSPSLFVASAAPASAVTAPRAALFACPSCLTALPDRPSAAALQCPNSACGLTWSVDNGLYDFKEPRAAA